MLEGRSQPSDTDPSPPPVSSSQYEKSTDCPREFDTTIPLNPVASPFKASEVRVPHPTGTTAPLNENPKTVLPPALTVNPADAASPPDAPDTVVPSTSN